MFHLVEDTMTRIESNLIKSGKIRDSWFSFWFNIIVLGIVLSLFTYFLMYNQKLETEKQVEFKPQSWLNAVRGVPGDQDYGQIPKTEIGSSVQGFTNRSSATTF